MSQEKGDSPLLDIPYEPNPVLFLYEADSLGKKGIQNRVVNTLTYHSIEITSKLTIVLLGSRNPDSLEDTLRTIFPRVQVYHWATLLNPI